MVPRLDSYGPGSVLDLVTRLLSHVRLLSILITYFNAFNYTVIVLSLKLTKDIINFYGLYQFN